MGEWRCRGLQILVQRFDSASGLQEGCRPRRDRALSSPVAQLVERAAVNRLVAGSSPARGAISTARGLRLGSARPLAAAAGRAGEGAACRRGGRRSTRQGAVNQKFIAAAPPLRGAAAVLRPGATSGG